MLRRCAVDVVVGALRLESRSLIRTYTCIRVGQARLCRPCRRRAGGRQTPATSKDRPRPTGARRLGCSWWPTRMVASYSVVAVALQRLLRLARLSRPSTAARNLRRCCTPSLDYRALATNNKRPSYENRRRVFASAEARRLFSTPPSRFNRLACGFPLLLAASRGFRTASRGRTGWTSGQGRDPPTDELAIGQLRTAGARSSKMYEVGTSAGSGHERVPGGVAGRICSRARIFRLAH